MAPDLVPVLRTDVTGRTQRRWERASEGRSATTAIPSPAAPLATRNEGEAALRRALERIPGAGGHGRIELLRGAPDFEAHVRAAVHCEATGNDTLMQALLSETEAQVVMLVAESLDLVDAVASLPVHLGEDPPQKRYRKTLERCREVASDYIELSVEDAAAFDAPDEAHFFRGALVAEVLRLSLRRHPLAPGAAQIALIGENIELFTRHLSALWLLRDEMWPRDIEADAETLRDLCAAMEDHGITDLLQVAAAVVERGRLDRDEALRILTADTPALAEGIL